MNKAIKFQVKGEKFFPCPYYPVGAIYLSIDPVNPSIWFGGVWEQIAQGRTLVGVDPSQMEFNTVKKTGGEKEHTLSIYEIPSHNHGLNFSPVTYGQNNTNVAFNSSGNSTTGYYTYASSNGGGQAHNNLQPYFTCYIWCRKA